MPWPMQNGKRRYDLELDEDTHWTIVEMGARFRMHEEEFLEFLLKEVFSAVKEYKEGEGEDANHGEKSDGIS